MTSTRLVALGGRYAYGGKEGDRAHAEMVAKSAGLCGNRGIRFTSVKVADGLNARIKKDWPGRDGGNDNAGCQGSWRGGPNTRVKTGREGGNVGARV